MQVRLLKINSEVNDKFRLEIKLNVFNLNMTHE